MAITVEFPEANFVWKGPTEDIGDLHSYVHEVADQTPLTISRWVFDEKEKDEILATDGVWLVVVGNHPPVRVTGHRPSELEQAQ